MLLLTYHRIYLLHLFIKSKKCVGTQSSCSNYMNVSKGNFLMNMVKKCERWLNSIMSHNNIVIILEIIEKFCRSLMTMLVCEDITYFEDDTIRHNNIYISQSFKRLNCFVMQCITFMKKGNPYRTIKDIFICHIGRDHD